MTVTTTTWFGRETDRPGPSVPTQYTLIESYSLDSSQSPKHGVVDAILDATDRPADQTTLTLYEHLDPDALDALIDASAGKRSHVEIRFTVDEYLVVVRSTSTVLVYEPLRAPE